MRWLRRLWHKSLTEPRLESELQFHVEQQAAEYITAGLPHDEARRRASIEFGGVERFKEECREARWENRLGILARDFQFAFRGLLKYRCCACIAVGLAASLALSRVLVSQLWGVSPHDPLTLASVALLLLVVDLVACWIPARRATRVNPSSALRYDDAVAFVWFQKAATQGRAGARIMLGSMYAAGRGAAKDLPAAYLWISAAALQGDTRGNALLLSLERQLTPAQLAQAKLRVRSLVSASGAPRDVASLH